MSVRLLFALHFHQPVGNFDHVFRDAVRLCYAPILDHFERHPGVGASFHFSGCLLEWLEANDRPFLDRLLALVGSGQVEPLGGGFYEPILPAIPPADALDQIDRLASWWQKRAGVRPRGAWIAERVWEPGLAALMAEAGVAYTILDDQHLRFAGLLDDRFSGLFVTERHGRAVGFFPSDLPLRYLIPFRAIDQVRGHFAGLANGGGPPPVLTYGDDAEKLGFWPGTQSWVFGEKWLDKFFALLEEPDGPVRATSAGSYFDESPVARKVYVPNASYTEMLEWALPAEAVAAYTRVRESALKGAPAEAVRAFVRGSLWDMFLARYPEADNLHKHVLWTSRRARALPPATATRDEAITQALRAQCNCPYWHGLFGGIYFPHLRHGVYESVLAADALLAQADPAQKTVVEAADLDGDGVEEIVLRAAGTQAIFRPGDAGTMAELDFLPARFNVTNVVARWRESYHEGKDITHAQDSQGGVASPHEKAVGIARGDLQGRHFDELPLRSLRDFRSAGRPSPAALVSFRDLERLRGGLERWRLAPQGFEADCRLGTLRYARTVSLEPSGLLRIVWIPEAGKPWSGWFGTILCLTLLAREAPGRSLAVMGEAIGRVEGAPGDALEADDAARLTLQDRVFGFGLDLAPRPAARLVTAPVETLQRSEDRYESLYQGTLVAVCWNFDEAGSPPDRFELTLAFRRIAGEGRTT